MQDEDMKTIHEALSEFPPSTTPQSSKAKEKPKSTKPKSKVKSEEEIRARRLELFDILDEAEGTVPYKECIEGILSEYRWILCEEEEKKKIKVREV